MVYTRLRPNPVFASLLESAAFLVLFTLALAISSYLATSLARPTWDHVFDAADKAIGFDFVGHLAFLQTRPRLATFIELAYMTSMAQVAVVALALAFSGSLDRLRLFIVLFAFTGTATIVVSGVWPTLGAYAFHDVQDWQLPPFLNPRVGWEQTPHILALREGTMREFPLGDVRGLVSFPSFHTALAIVTSWAIWRTRYLGPLVGALNVPLVLATPSNGSHYLCDIIGGAAIAFAALVLVTGLERRRAPAMRLAGQTN